MKENTEESKPVNQEERSTVIRKKRYSSVFEMKEKIMRAFNLGMQAGIDGQFIRPRFLLEIESMSYEYGHELGESIRESKNWGRNS
jgi:hypothetical protein